MKVEELELQDVHENFVVFYEDDGKLAIDVDDMSRLVLTRAQASELRDWLEHKFLDKV